MNIGNVVEQYIGLRNDVANKKKEFEAFKKETELVMKDLEMQILEVSNSTGVDSFKTASGTAFKTTKTYAKLFNPEARIEYAKRTGDYSLFTGHVTKAHAISLLDEGVLPDEIGIEVDSEQVIQFRKN